MTETATLPGLETVDPPVPEGEPKRWIERGPQKRLMLFSGSSNRELAERIAETLGVEDEGLEGVEYRESLKPMLEQLPPREKRILMLRFFKNMTQSEIAAEIGISQMHVSRLLARTLAQLREGLLVDE
jgi:RNA polymerase sigma-B factor